MRMTEDQYQNMRLNAKKQGLEQRKRKSDAVVAEQLKESNLS